MGSFRRLINDLHNYLKNKLKKNFIRILVSIALMALGSWTVHYNWLQRSVNYDSYVYSIDEAQRLKNYPMAQYAHGMQAWLRQDPKTAAKFFRQAISNNVLYLDGWLRLAEAEAALGNQEKAEKILAFTTSLTDQVFRWKWPQMLLARELGMTDSLYRNSNFLLSYGVLEQDTFQLIHTHLNGDAERVVAVLDPEHLDAYLNWLMQWTMIDESLVVWQAISDLEAAKKETALRYAHFLLHNKRISVSREIWSQYTGIAGLTNPGFEMDITRQGFDWYFWNDNNGNWEFKRVNRNAFEGNFALKIIFSGRENISFQHVYQIIAVEPHEKYRLTYHWRSRRITSDQGPFVEISSFDRQGLYIKGPMITGTNSWHTESIEFAIPDGCQAALIRLRRLPSQRFDSKIRGVLWLDDFRLSKIPADMEKPHSDISIAVFGQGGKRRPFNYSTARFVNDGNFDQ